MGTGQADSALGSTRETARERMGLTGAGRGRLVFSCTTTVFEPWHPRRESPIMVANCLKPPSVNLVSDAAVSHFSDALSPFGSEFVPRKQCRNPCSSSVQVQPQIDL